MNKVGRPKYADMCKENVTGPDWRLWGAEDVTLFVLNRGHLL